MNPLINRIFKNRDHASVSKNNSRKNLSADKNKSLDRSKLVPKITNRNAAQSMRTTMNDTYDDKLFKQRIILPAIKHYESQLPPKTPMDGRRSRQVSSLRKRMVPSVPLSSEQLPVFDASPSFFATQNETPQQTYSPSRAQMEPKTIQSQHSIIDTSGLAQKLFGDQQKLELFEYIKAISLNSDLEEEFCYMNRGEMPYEYYIVEYENRNRQEYLTVSKRGVTFHTGGEGDFYTREMLLREIKLYNRIKLIPFYQNYLIVKTLKVWKNAMLKRRFDTASQSLEKGLHNLAPHSNQYMSMVGNFLYELSHINFLESRISKTMELSEFTKLLKKQQKRVEDDFSFYDKSLYNGLVDCVNKSTKQYRNQNRITIGDDSTQRKAFLVLDPKKNQMRFTQLATLKVHQDKMISLAKLIDLLREGAKIKAIEHGLASISSTLENAYNKFYKDNSGTNIPWIKIRVKIEKSPTTDFQFVCEPSAAMILNVIEGFFQQTIRHLWRAHKQFVNQPEFINYERDQFDTEQVRTLKDYLDMDDNIETNKTQIIQQLQNAFIKVHQFLQASSNLLEIYNGTLLTHPLQYYLQNVHLKAYLQSYEIQKTVLRDIKQQHQFGIFHVDFTKVKTQLNTQFNDKYNTVTTSVPQQVIRRSQTLTKNSRAVYEQFKTNPDSIEEYIEFTSSFKSKKVEVDEIANKIDELRELEEMLYKNRIKIGEKAKMEINTAVGLYLALKKRIEEIQRDQEKLRVYFEKQLEQMAPSLEDKSERLLERLYFDGLVTNPMSDSKKVVAYISQLEVKFKQIELDKNNFYSFQKRLATGYSQLEKFLKLQKEFNCLQKLWVFKEKYDAMEISLQKDSYKKIDFSVNQGILNEFLKEINRGFKDLQTVQILQYFKSITQNLTNLLFACKLLCDDDLLQRHYDEIRKLLKNDKHNSRILFSTDGLLLPAYELQLRFDIRNRRDDIEAVVVKASNEALIIKSMVAIQSFWKTSKLQFDLNDTLAKNDQIYCLALNEEISEKVDQNIIHLTTLGNSKYVEYVRGRVNQQKQVYLYFRELLDLWAMSQKEWIRLYPIMTSASSIKYHSGAYHQFLSTDNSIRRFNKQMHDMSNTKKIAEDFIVQSYLNTLKSCYAQLEKLRKTLEEYMNQKRINYSRFYFLTDTQLISLLQDVKDWQSMEPYLKLCFDLDGFIVEKDMALGVRSGTQSFKVRSLFFKGEVDEWFKAVDQNTRNAVRSMIKTNLAKYRTDTNKNMLNEFPLQVLLSLQLLLWTQMAERSLQNTNVVVFAKLCKDEVDTLITKLMNSSPKNRLTISCLLLQSLHLCEAASALAVNESTIKDFKWYQNIRMYIIQEEVQVHQICHAIPYGYEYHRPYMHPVFTSMTERIAFNIFRASYNKQGLIVDGPDACGKTQTMRQVARLTGNFFKNFTCSSDLEHAFLLKFITGICLTGVWGCMDAFARLNFQTMSMMFQKFIQIKNHRMTQEPFEICGRTINIHKNTMFFICRDMNNSENAMQKAKISFNQVYAIQPDYSKICEWMLLADGFKQWKSMAAKICGVFDFCREIFSLKNYNFKLSSMRRTLNKAMLLRRLQNYPTEQAVIYQALRIEIMSNLLEADKAIFKATLKKFFNYEEDEIMGLFVMLILQHPYLEQVGLKQRYQQLEEGLVKGNGCVIITGPRTSKTTLLDIFAQRTGFQMLRMYPLSQMSTWSDATASLASSLLDTNIILVFDAQLGSWVQLINASRNLSNSVVVVNNQKLEFPFRMIFESRSLKDCPPSFISLSKVVHVEEKVDGVLLLTKNLKKSHLPQATQKLIISFAQPYVKELKTEELQSFESTVVSLHPSNLTLREKVLQKLVIWVLAFILKNDLTFWNKNYPGKYYDLYFSKSAEDFVPISGLMQDLIIHQDQLFHDILVCTKQMAYYKLIISSYVENSKHLILEGPRLCFKTSYLRYCTKDYLKIVLSSPLTNQRTFESQMDSKLTNIRKGNILAWANEQGPYVIEIDDMHMAAPHMIEAIRKIGQQGSVRLRINLQNKYLQNCSIIATSSSAQAHPRCIGPLSLFALEPATSESVSSISNQMLTSFLKYHNFKRQVIDSCMNCVTALTILFNDMQKVNSMQLNSVRILHQILKHMLSIKQNIYIDAEDYVNLFVSQLHRIALSRAKSTKETESQITAILENALKVAFRGQATLGYWVSYDGKMQKTTIEEVISNRLPKMPDRILFEEAIRLVLVLNNQHHVEHGHTVLAGLAGSGKKFLCYLSSIVSERKFIDIKSEMMNQAKDFRPCIFEYIKKVMFQQQKIIIYQSSLSVFNENKTFYELLIKYTGEQYDFWSNEQKSDLDKQAKVRQEQVNNIWHTLTSRLINGLSIVFTFQINKDLKGLLADSSIFSCYYCELAEWPEQALVAAASKITENNVALMSMLHYQLSPMIENFTKHTPSLKTFEKFIRLTDKLSGNLMVHVSEQHDLFKQVHYKIAESCEKIREWQSKAEILRIEIKVLLIKLEKNIQRMAEQKKQLEKVKKQEQLVEAKLTELAAQLDEKTKGLDKELKRLNKVMEKLQKILNSLSRYEFGEVKKLYSSHNLLKFSLQCLAILQNMEVDAQSLNKMLADPNLLMKLKNMKLQDATQPIKQKLRNRIYLNKEFTPAEIQKINIAGKALCEWIYTVVDFWNSYEESEHKKLELKYVKEENVKTMEKAKVTRLQIDALKTKLKTLEEQNNEAIAKKAEAERDLTMFEIRLANAAQITPYLMGQEESSLNQIVKWKDATNKVTGNCILTSLVVYYSCQMDYKHRIQILEKAKKTIQYENVQFDPEGFYDYFKKAEHSYMEERLVHNFICMDNCQGVPLIIDPERKAVEMLFDYYPKMTTQTAKDEEFSLKLIDLVASPGILLVTDIEVIDYGELHKILKDTKRVRDFKLILYTDKAYERIRQDILSKTIPVNWRSSLYESGAKLLKRFIEVNRPDLVTRRQQNSKMMIQSEERIKQIKLELFSKLKDRALMILEDQDFIMSLRESAKLQQSVRDELSELKKQQQDIISLEHKYQQIVENIAYAVQTLEDVVSISLEMVLQLMSKQEDNLIRIIKWALKILPITKRNSYLFVVCLKVKHEFNIHNYFVRNIFQQIPSSHQPKVKKPSACASMSQTTWKELHGLIQFGPKFEQLIENILKQPKEWQVWFFSHKVQLPSCLNIEFNMVETLVLIRKLKPYKFFQFIQKYIEEVFSYDFLAPENELTEQDFLHETNNRYPILLPAGLSACTMLSHRMGVEAPTVISLALEQSELMEMTQKHIEQGRWLCLIDCQIINEKNIKLLEKIIKNVINKQDVHPNYRMFLLGVETVSSDYITHLSVTLYMEGASVKNMMKEIVTPERFKQETNKDLNKLSWLVCLAHCVMAGKNKYPLAYQSQLTVTNSKLDSCFQVIQYMKDKSIQVNFQALAQTFTQIYSSQAGSQNDRLVINGVISSFIDENVANSFNIFSYPVPESNFIATVDDLPAIDEYEVFGFHFNIMIAMDALQVQRVEHGARGYRVKNMEKETNQADILRVNDMARKVPSIIKIQPVQKWIHYSRNYETQKINSILERILKRFEQSKQSFHQDISQVSKSVRLFNSCIALNILPQQLYELYPIKSTNQSFTLWIDDIIDKANFLKSWASSPYRVFRPCNFFNFTLLIQSFKMSQSERKNEQADTLAVQYKFTRGYDYKEVLVNQGILLEGLFMDQCKYSPERKCLDDPVQGMRLAKAPVMHVTASVPTKSSLEAIYCLLPVYSQPSRDRLITYFQVESDRIVNWISKGASIVSL